MQGTVIPDKELVILYTNRLSASSYTRVTKC